MIPALAQLPTAALARDGRLQVIAVEWLPSRVQIALNPFVAGVSRSAVT